MITQEAFSSRSSSVPHLLREDDDDETDEILIFERDGDTPTAFEVEEENDDYDVGCYDHEALPHGYSLRELEQPVTFVRSSKNSKTGDFDRDCKSVLWCLENGFEEVQPGVWSGLWYFTYLFGETEGKREWTETINKRLVKEGGGRAREISSDNHRAMLQQKEKGKRAFHRGQYKTALDCFVQAEELMGGDVMGMYLVPHQRAEMVTLLSNQSECYLRLKKYDNAIVQATKALQLDKRHSKSLLRRAKATLESSDTLVDRSTSASMIVESVADDLHAIIHIKGEGFEEAQALLKETEDKLHNAANSLRSQQ